MLVGNVCSMNGGDEKCVHSPSTFGGGGGVKLQVSCLCLTFNDLRDCFPCALQCAIAEIGVAARTWFDVSSCNKTQ